MPPLSKSTIGWPRWCHAAHLFPSSIDLSMSRCPHAAGHRSLPHAGPDHFSLLPRCCRLVMLPITSPHLRLFRVHSLPFSSALLQELLSSSERSRYVHTCVVIACLVNVQCTTFGRNNSLARFSFMNLYGASEDELDNERQLNVVIHLRPGRSLSYKVTFLPLEASNLPNNDGKLLAFGHAGSSHSRLMNFIHRRPSSYVFHSIRPFTRTSTNQS